MNLISEGFSRVRLSARHYQPFVSLVMNTSDQGAAIVPVVRSVLALDYPSYEIIIIDQSQNRDTFLALFPFLDLPHFHYYRLPEQNVARQRNFAVRISRATLVGIIDDKTVLAANWLSDSVAQLRANPQAAMLLVDEGPAGQPTAFYQTVSAFARTEATGKQLLMRRRAFYDIGGFDELVGEHAESWPAAVADMAVRALLEGYEVNAVQLPGAAGNVACPEKPVSASWFEYGVMCAKPVKAGVFAGLPLTFQYLFVRALRTGKRPQRGQLANIREFLRGFSSGMDLPLCADSLRFQPPQTRGLDEQKDSLVLQSSNC
ncbi:MAG: glycosyltransferase [Anaerolineales bacterium]|nr:glycosyltransferase [Anaerolineales bacterium]MCB8960052.1 glycosyltransferase [Ardenticatenales bacterium]